MTARKGTRDRLLDSALELFCRNGYDGVSTRAIAGKAGVNEVTLFRLFGTKENVFLAVIDREANIRDLLPPGAFEPTEDVVRDLTRLGTFIMAAPSFLLTLGTNGFLLFSFLFIMTIGEAMWQPRFLQYAAEIAPEGRTGAYMGVAQFPWFLTKMIVPAYSGWFLQHYCPEPGKGLNLSGTMWLIFGCIAMMSTVLLILAKGWLGKDFKTKHA